MNTMTPSRLKAKHLENHPTSHFFDRDTMGFFGDTMKNYAVTEHADAYELRRKRPVKYGLMTSTFFTKDTFDFIHGRGK